MREEVYQKTTLDILGKVGCDYIVFTGSSTAQEVEDAYFRALKEGKKEGYTPVLVPSDDILAEWLGILEDEDYSREKVIASHEDGKAFLHKCLEEYTSYWAKEGDCNVETFMEDLIGDTEAAEGEEINYFTSYINYGGEGIKEVILFKIPVKNPWEVVAWLPMGGWNACPPAEEMMAVAKYWYEQHGAVIASVTHDTLEFYVEDPVKDGETARELAKEMYSFCTDIVDQGSGSIAELCETIKQSRVWFFWWD